jgi:hypothetical protein
VVDNQAERIANGEIGTCQICGRLCRLRIPNGGDGSLRVTWRHNKQSDPKKHCEGSGVAAKEWE